LGKEGVGKSNLITNFIGMDNYEHINSNANHFYVYEKSKCLGPNLGLEITKLNIQDFSITECSYLSSSHYFIIIYAVNDKDSFDSVPRYLNLVKKFLPNTDVSLPILLVANKCDIEEKERVVTKEMVEEILNDNKITHIETSSFHDKNIKRIFWKGLVSALNYSNIIK